MATYTTLRYGSTGEDVKKLQTALGFTGKDVDGIFGNKTQQAVKDFQTKNGLTVDGIAGNQTFGKLYATAPAATTPTTQPSAYKYEEFKYDPYTESDAVKEAQAMLQQQIANKPGEAQSAWQSQLNETLDKILNREDFSYDLNGDVLYQQYKDQATTQGKLASMDAMGQAAAMTGGFGNSYAQSVGQQTYQGYLQGLNDKVPELYQLALNQYNQEGQNLKDQASMLDSLVQQDYEKYRDTVSDYYTELQYLTDRADTLSKDEYDRYIDNINLKYGIHSDTQKAGSDARSDATDLALSMLGMGAMPSNDILAAAGLSSADAQAIVQKVNEQASSGSTSGSVSGTTGSSNNSDIVKKAQEFVGTSVDGIWGANSTAKAKEKGYNSLEEVIAAMGNTGGVTSTAIPDNIKQKAATFEDNESLAAWAYRLADTGVISEDQADQLIAEHLDGNEKTTEVVNKDGTTSNVISYKNMVKSTKGWTVLDDGGANWLGIDRDAKVKSPNGEQLTLLQLRNKLTSEGMTTSEANKAIKVLQQNLGISSNWLLV